MSEDVSGVLQDLSLNHHHPNKSADSSLGLLNADALKNLSAFSEYDVTKENLEPATNISLGQYLQPGGEESLASQPLSDSEEEDGGGGEASGFNWDQVVQANNADNSASLQLGVTGSCVDDWHPGGFQDPSFCSGKFSARSTSFGGLNQTSNTRDENFSDFSKVPSFQGSYLSHCSSKVEESVWRSGHGTGHLATSQSGLFPGLDPQSQADLGLQFGEEEFGSLGKAQLENFFENEEAECLKENPFIEEEPCQEESRSNSSLLSGVSDKSIMLRNSNLWGGDTSRVDLDQLRREENVVTKLSRCDYFRHNSSRLGSLDESVEETQRPKLGFFHNIRSPERQPCALLAESSPPVEGLSSTFSMESPAQKEEERVESGPSSANSSYMASGDSTKTVVSLMEQSDTMKATDLASRLQFLADQLASQSSATSYPDVVEDSICSTSRLEESIRETLDTGTDINISTISKVLSEASISNDPQHFVNVILGCLKTKAGAGAGPAEKLGENPEAPTKKITFCQVEPQSIKSIPTDSVAGNPKLSSASLPRSGKRPSTLGGRLSDTPTSKLTPTESKRAMMRLSPTGSNSSSRRKPVNKIKPFCQGSGVKPVASSAPGSARNTPSPPLVKSESVPAYLNRQRKLSGARHSSPIKKVEEASPQLSTPNTCDLSRLLDTEETPQVRMAATSQLTTSTPFHPNTNLSLVMMDHLTHNTSLSPLVNPDTSICPVSLDVSTISPALYTSVLKVSKRRETKRPEKVEMLPDWSHAGVVPSHTKIVLSVPIESKITNYSNCIVKMTNIWVGSYEVPSEHWDQLASLQRETLVLLQHDTKTLDLELELKRGGAFTFNVGLMLDSGESSSGLVRVRAEEPNIQVLTEDGKILDFGVVPANSSASAKLMLVNCGESEVPLCLEMDQSSQVFSLEDGGQQHGLTLPGVAQSGETRGQGVLTEISVRVNTSGLSLTEARIFKTSLRISLGGDRDGTLLGAVEVLARLEPDRALAPAGRSKPGLSFGVLKKSESGVKSVEAGEARGRLPSVFPVESDRSLVNYFCVGVGSVEAQTVTLRNATNSSISLSLIIRDSSRFLLEDKVSTMQVQLQPGETREVSVSFSPEKVGVEYGKLVLKPQGQAAGGKSYKASLSLCGVGGEARVVMEGLDHQDGDQVSLNVEEGSGKKTVTLTNTGQYRGFVKITADSSTARCLDLSATAFILGPGQTKTVTVSQVGEVGAGREVLKVMVFHGPELARLIMKKARKLAGGAKLCSSPAELGFNFTEEFPGENIQDLQEEFQGQLTAADVKHFFKKTLKKCLTINFPGKPMEFDQLAVEETLSETRIDQSIALPLPTSCSVSPPTPDTVLKVVPDKLDLKAGEETLMRLVNLSVSPVDWDVAWPGSKLSLSPGSGVLRPRAETVLRVRAGQTGWRGQLQVLTENGKTSVEVRISPADLTHTQRGPGLVLSAHKMELTSPRIGQSSSGQVTITNPGQELVQWRAILQPSFFSLPLSTGLLNPGQSVTVAVLYKPAAVGSHSASLTISSHVVRGGHQAPGETSSNTIQLNAKCGDTGKKLGSGSVTLERDVIVFPNTKVGEVSIAKVKIENRSGADRIIQLEPINSSAFRTVHSVVEVKSRCFSTVPIHFRPGVRGDHSASVCLSWEENTLSASLHGNGV